MRKKHRPVQPTVIRGITHTCGNDEWYIRTDGTPRCAPCQREISARNAKGLPRPPKHCGPAPVFKATPPRPLSKTSKEVKRKARVGQGAWRRDLLKSWGGRCAVTGYGSKRHLRASHTKQWSKCTDAEKLDVFNGFPLVPALDDLFNQHDLTFLDDGTGVLNPEIDPALYGLPQVPLRLRYVAPEHLPYLAEHRKLFKGVLN